MAKAKRQAIIVLGMHRSGTSALAGALGILGMRLPAKLLPPTADNPKGYFESDRIVAIHDRLLVAAGTNWSGVESLSEDWFQSAEATAFVNKLVAAVRQDYSNAATFVVKDPRMCRLMPLWRRVLDRVGAQGRYAIPLRNPLEVARSLEKRDGLPLAHGCLLWLRHMLDAERETRGSPRVFVHYHDLLSDPVGIATRVASRLAEEKPALSMGKKAKISSLVDPELRHHMAKPEDLHLDETFYPWLWEAYEAFGALVERPTDKAAKHQLDRVRAAFDRAVTSFAPVIAASEKKLAERNAEISVLGKTLSKNYRQLARLGHAVAERDGKLISLGQAVFERDGQMASLGQAVAERDGQIASLGQAVAERDGQIASLGQAAATREEEIRSLVSELQEIYGSTIWHLIAPMRWYGRLQQRIVGFAKHRGNTPDTLKPDSSQQPKPRSVGQPPTPTRSSGSPYRCSLVIPTKNGGELFKRVIEALQTQTCWDNVEFIVVDSGSTDDTVAVARSAGAIIRHVPPNEFNHGATRDYAISLATNNYVVLMVQDAVPGNNRLLERLVTALSEEGVAGVYARQIPQQTADPITKRNLNSWLTGGLERRVKAMESVDWYENLPPTEKFFFCNFDNVCSAINRRVWKEERFGRVNFGEDILWAERILKLKFKIIYEPAAIVVHSHNRSLIHDYQRAYICNRLLYRHFAIHAEPSFTAFLRLWFHEARVDMSYVVRVEKRRLQRLRMLFVAAANSFVTALGKYRSVKDEIRDAEQKARSA